MDESLVAWLDEHADDLDTGTSCRTCCRGGSPRTSPHTGRPCASGGYARRAREAAFLAVVTPTVAQLNGDLARLA
jgi:hypothetical protein